MQAFSKTHQGREIAFDGFTTPSSDRLPFRNGWGRQCPFRALAACQRRRPLLHKPAREEWGVIRPEYLVNLGSEDVKQLAVISPAIMGPAYFREAAEVINAAAGGQPDRAKMAEVFRRHSMTVAAHPPGK